MPTGMLKKILLFGGLATGLYVAYRIYASQVSKEGRTASGPVTLEVPLPTTEKTAKAKKKKPKKSKAREIV